MKLPWKKEERAQELQQDGAIDNESQLIRVMMGRKTVDKQMAAEIPAVQACIDKIAASVAAVDFKLYKVENGVPKVQNDNRVKLLNGETGDTLDSVQFWKAIVRDYFLDKGGYAYVNWVGNQAKSIHYVEADKISFLSNEDPIFKKCRIFCGGRTYESFQFMKILRHTTDGWKGQSIVKENDMLMWTAYSELKFEGTQVSKGGNKKGFLQSERRVEQGVIDKVREAFRNLYSNESDNIVVLNSGLKFQESSNTAVEMQLNELKRENARDFYRIFQIPSSIMEGGATEADIRLYHADAVKPIVDAIKSQADRYLLLESEKESMYFDYDMSSLMKGDIKSRYDAYKTALDSGFYTIDEIRVKENEEPLGLSFVKLNLADVLYDPQSKTIYAVNTDRSMSIEDLKKGGKSIDESGNQS